MVRVPACPIGGNAAGSGTRPLLTVPSRREPSDFGKIRTSATGQKATFRGRRRVPTLPSKTNRPTHEWAFPIDDLALSWVRFIAARDEHSKGAEAWLMVPRMRMRAYIVLPCVAS